jgi:DNA-binding CsgD family transcriptional regulator
MWYFDEPGGWNITAAISDTQGQWGINDSTNFTFKEWGYFTLAPVSLNWSNIVVGLADQIADFNITLNNTGNSIMSNITVNASNLAGTETGRQHELVLPSWFRVANASLDYCNGPALVLNETISSQLNISPVDSSESFPAFGDLGFCLKEITSVSAQLYNSTRAWEVEIVFSLTLFAVANGKKKKKKKKKKKGVLEVFDKRLKDKYVDFEGLLSLDESLREKYNLGVEELLEIAKKKEDGEEVKIPIILFKQNISPAEILCKYLKENLGLRFSEIARLLNRDDRTVWINYRNAVKKKSEKIEVEKKVLISIKIFSDRRLSVLEAVVNYLKNKGFRNNEIAEILNKDQRNIYTLYSRARKKLLNL